MYRTIIAFAVAISLLSAVSAHALTADEEELLRKAGVSEERISEMKAASPAQTAPAAEPAPPAPAPPAPAAPVSDALKDAARALDDAAASLDKADASKPAFSITDWNEDGINDIVSGCNSGELVVYINTGSNESPEFEDAEEVEDGDVDSGTVSVPCIVDWNNDGLKDVLLGNRGGTVYLYLNTGTNSRPVFAKGDELMDGDVDSGGYSAPAVADWNGDGRKDLILGDFGGHLNVYINIGSDENPRFGDDSFELKAEMFNYSTFNYTTPFVVKNHQNGLFDIVTGCGDGRIYRFINAGSKTAPRFMTPQHVLVNDFVFELEGNTNVIAVDWDNDGKEDLIVSNRTSTQTQGTSSANQFSSGSRDKKHYSKAYFLKNVGTNEHPRYDRAVEILRDSMDINL